MRCHVNNCLAINKSILIKPRDQKIPSASTKSYCWCNALLLYLFIYLNLKWNNKQLRIKSNFKRCFKFCKTFHICTKFGQVVSQKDWWMMESRAMTPSLEGAKCLEGKPTGGVDRSADEGRQERVEEFFLTASLWCRSWDYWPRKRDCKEVGVSDLRAIQSDGGLRAN